MNHLSDLGIDGWIRIITAAATIVTAVFVNAMNKRNKASAGDMKAAVSIVTDVKHIVNSERDAMLKELETFRTQVLTLSKQIATMEEQARALVSASLLEDFRKQVLSLSQHISTLEAQAHAREVVK